MKTRTFKTGRWTYKTYMKPVGHGYECGVTQGGKPIFVGNFLKPTEARTWYTKMTGTLSSFTKKYKKQHPPKSAHSFYNRFISNTLYSKYYDYLDKHFTKYTRTFKTAHNKDLRKMKKMTPKWKSTGKTYSYRKAA